MKTSSKFSQSIFICFVIILLANFSTAHGQWVKEIIDDQIEFPFYCFAGDIEDDGDNDILVVHATDLENLAGETIWYKAPNWEKQIVFNGIGIAEIRDMNNDGKNDIVAADLITGIVAWYEAPSLTKHIIQNDLPGASGVAVEDLDEDGDLDVVAAGAMANRIEWYEAPNWIVHPISMAFAGAAFPKVVDLDSDNDLDILVMASFDNNAGIAWFEAPAWTFHSIDSSLTDGNQMGFGDIDADGDIDITAGDTGFNRLFWYENPSWERHEVDDLRDAWGSFVADLNMDNKVDIIATGQGSNEVVWYEGPSLTKHVVDSNLVGASGIAIADMDGNGKLDIVVCGAMGNTVALYKSKLNTSVETAETSQIPDLFILKQNYPNPFNPGTTIRFTLPKAGFVTLKIYNSLGREIATLIDEYRTSGEHKVTWRPAEDVPGGIYLYRLRAGEFVETKKLILQK